MAPRHHTFVEQSLHAVVALLGYLGTSQCLLPHLIGALNLLYAGSVLCFCADGSCGGLGTLCLLCLCPQLGGVDDGKRVAHLHVVAFLEAQLQNASRHLAGNPVFGDFHFALNLVRRLVEGEESDNGHHHYYGYESEDGEQYVVMLTFC